MSALAYFVSPHGFGHAARASAVMTALRRRRPQTAFHVFTTVPRWFFDDSVGAALAYHPLRTDVGFVQLDPLVEDLPATVAALEDFWSSMDVTAVGLAETLRRLEIRLVVCDVSPLGLAAAERAGLPSVLAENFTWDWIYEAYLEAEPRLGPFARRNAAAMARASRRAQMEPVCAPVATAVRVGPVSRAPRASRGAVRRALGLDDGDSRPMVLLTMGGQGWRGEAVGAAAEDVFVVTLGGTDSLRRAPGWLALPDRAPIYPPDLTAAADLVVAKLGYSTVAECFRGGARLAFLERPRFPESDVLAAFCRRRLGAVEIDRATLDSGEWRGLLPDLLARPAPAAGAATGAEELADLLARELD